MGLWRRLSEFWDRARRLDPENPGRDVEFTLAVIALGGKLAKSDGQVTPDEAVAFHQVFQWEGEDLHRADAAFARAGQTTLGYQSYAHRLARRWRAYPCLLEDVLDGLFHIAAADGVISDEEVAYLADVADIFGLSEHEFGRISASWASLDAVDPYTVLGVEPDISDSDLRRAYRRMATANHPDRFAARGLPMSAERVANEKMAAINAAYHAILAKRGLAPVRGAPGGDD